MSNVVPVTQPPETQSILAVIERAASSPDVDVDKMERLLAMHERIVAKHAEAEFNAALNRAQAKMRPIAADAENPQTRSRYASYAALDRALRPIYVAENLSLSFDTDQSPLEGHIRVLCYVSHSAGHTRTYKVDMPSDGKGAKGGDVMTKTHATGAGMAYGMRYLVKFVFNVAVGEDDTDGNNESIDENQIANLESLITEVKANRAFFLKFCKVDSIEKLPASKYKAAVAALEAKRQ